MTANRVLADRARQAAEHAPAGSAERRAALCAAVALGTTTTLTAARNALSDVGIAAVRTAAVELLDKLASEAAP